MQHTGLMSHDNNGNKHRTIFNVAFFSTVNRVDYQSMAVILVSPMN